MFLIVLFLLVIAFSFFGIFKEGLTCSKNSDCTSINGYCSQKNCYVKKGVNSVCYGHDQCLTSLCEGTETGPGARGVCSDKYRLGDKCTYDNYCSTGNYCINGNCSVPLADGADCTNNRTKCLSNSYCRKYSTNPDIFKCVSKDSDEGKDGKHCKGDAWCNPDYTCMAGANVCKKRYSFTTGTSCNNNNLCMSKRCVSNKCT